MGGLEGERERERERWVGWRGRESHNFIQSCRKDTDTFIGKDSLIFMAKSKLVSLVL